MVQMVYRLLLNVCLVYVPTPASMKNGVLSAYNENVPMSLWLWLSALYPPFTAKNNPSSVFMKQNSFPSYQAVRNAGRADSAAHQDFEEANSSLARKKQGKASCRKRVDQSCEY